MQGGSHTLDNHQTAIESPISVYKYIYRFFKVYTAFVFQCRNVQSYFSSAYATFHRINVSVRILKKKKKDSNLCLFHVKSLSDGLALMHGKIN